MNDRHKINPALLEAILKSPYGWKGEKPPRTKTITKGKGGIRKKKLKGGRVRFRDALRVLMGPAGWISLAVENHKEKKAEQKKEQEEIDRKLDEKFGLKPTDGDSPNNDVTTSLTFNPLNFPDQPKLPEPSSDLPYFNDITLFEEDPFNFE